MKPGRNASERVVRDDEAEVPASAQGAAPAPPPTTAGDRTTRADTQEIPGSLKLLPWILLVPALAAAIVFGILWWGLHSQEATRDDVRATSTEASLALTQFSYKDVESDIAQIKKVATGDFENQVKQLFSKNTVSQIRKVQAVSDSQVQSVFVQSVSGDSATAFAVVQETISNKLSKTPQTQTVRLQLDLVNTTGGWKVDQVTLFQTPTQSGLGG